MNEETHRDPNFFWTKTWGHPTRPSDSMLAFSAFAYRQDAIGKLQRGDIVVYLTADDGRSEPAYRGRVSGAVEVVGDVIDAETLGLPDRASPESFREDGRFRWPFGLTISRSWRVTQSVRNDHIIPLHADKKMMGAQQIHPMTAQEAAHFMSLEVIEVTDDGEVAPEIFRPSLQRPWLQKAGERSGSVVVPGTSLYTLVISDTHGTTFKVGSGKPEERLADLNRYRRCSLGESRWSMLKRLVHEFRTHEAARLAEDHIILEGRRLGFGTPDHSEFLQGIDMKTLQRLFDEAVAIGRDRDFRETAPTL